MIIDEATGSLDAATERLVQDGLQEGKTNPYPTMRQFVFSHTIKESPDENVTLVSEGAVELVRDLKSEDGKDIWLCGGAELATTLFAAGLVDDLIIKLNPVLFGSGIPLFSGMIQQTGLELTDSKIYGSGITVLDYRVKREPSLGFRRAPALAQAARGRGVLLSPSSRRRQRDLLTPGGRRHQDGSFLPESRTHRPPRWASSLRRGREHGLDCVQPPCGESGDLPADRLVPG